MTEATCKFCGRRIIESDGAWIDPDATGDDAVWRETCDSHDTFEARHEPLPQVDNGTRAVLILTAELVRCGVLTQEQREAIDDRLLEPFGLER